MSRRGSLREFNQVWAEGGKRKIKLISFPVSFPIHMPVEFFPRRGGSTLLSVIIYYVGLPANLVHLDTLVIHWTDQAGQFRCLAPDSNPPSPSCLKPPPQDVTRGSLKAILRDNMLILVRLIDESIVEIPQACSKIRLAERPGKASTEQYWHLLEEGGTFVSGSNYWTSCCCCKKGSTHDSQRQEKATIWFKL